MGKKLWVPKPSDELPSGISWERGGFHVSVNTKYGQIRKRKKTMMGAVVFLKLLSHFPKPEYKCQFNYIDPPNVLPKGIRLIGEKYHTTGSCKFGSVRWNHGASYGQALKRLSNIQELDTLTVDGDVSFEDWEEVARHTTYDKSCKLYRGATNACGGVDLASDSEVEVMPTVVENEEDAPEDTNEEVVVVYEVKAESVSSFEERLCKVEESLRLNREACKQFL